MRTKHLIGFGTFAALVALCLHPFHSADAWEEHIDAVHERLKADHAHYAELGYTFVNYIVGSLRDDEIDTWTFRLSRGKDYVVSGACDDDCRDIDLRITTSSGLVVDRDAELDASPEVSVTPFRSREYSVEVEMYKCTLDPCYFGIALFER